MAAIPLVIALPASWRFLRRIPDIIISLIVGRHFYDKRDEEVDGLDRFDQRDFGAALRSVHQADVDQEVPEDVRDILSRLDNKQSPTPAIDQHSKNYKYSMDGNTESAATTEAGLPPPDESGQTYRVSYATNRMRNNENEIADGYSSRRSPTVTYGNCDVYVPRSHKIGSIGSGPMRRFLTGVDDRLVLTRISDLAPSTFWVSLNTRIAHSRGKHAVVFLHGYNVSFTEAAIRAAQIGVDLGIDAMAMFSWPSKGDAKGYPSDEASIEASTGAITEFLVSFTTQTEASEVHIIAHSMGNRGLLRAMERIGMNAEKRAGIKFGQIILAAPDVDADSFREMAAAYSQVAARTTLYVSERDKAVGLSAWLHDYPRIGFYPPVSIFEGVDTISVSNVDVSALGHGYVGEAREVLTDMHQLIFSGLPPEGRFSVRPAQTADGEPYWMVGR